MKDKSIIPDKLFYADGQFYDVHQRRREGLHRHEIFFGTANRKLSIKYGLYVYLKPEDHNFGSRGVHQVHAFDEQLKRYGQEIAMTHYGWTVDDFRDIFGRSYI